MMVKVGKRYFPWEGSQEVRMAWVAAKEEPESRAEDGVSKEQSGC